MAVTATTAITSPTYGAPLKLIITGLSVTSAFSGAKDISALEDDLKYSLQVFLEILN